MPQLFIHLSPTPPHWSPSSSSPSFVPKTLSYHIYFFLSFFTTTCIIFDAFLSCFSYICACSIGTFSAPQLKPFLYELAAYTPFSLHPTTQASNPAFPNHFPLRMDKEFSTPFSVTTTDPSTTTTTSSSNVNLAQQNMGYPHNANFSDNQQLQFCVPPPYLVPYDQNMRFPYPYMHTMPQVNNQPLPLGYPLCSVPMEQSGVLFTMPNLREEDKAWICKIARDKRKQARQRSRSSGFASSIKEETKGDPVTIGEENVQTTVTQNRNPYDFCAPNGKRLKEILTKELKNSDVGSLGRIVLPKREAELKLPALCDKEGIDVLLKDVYSDLQWSLKFKYWSNNKSRMYVLENTGDFVNHYELQMGDSVTLYEDEFKNLYVWARKEQKPEVAEASSKEQQTHDALYDYSYMQTPYKHRAKDEEEEAYLALLIEELSHHKEQEAANSLLSLCSGGGSSGGTEYHQTIQHAILPNSTTTTFHEGASSHQVADQATMEAAASSYYMVDADRHNRLDEYFYGGLGMSEFWCNYLTFDRLTDD